MHEQMMGEFKQLCVGLNIEEIFSGDRSPENNAKADQAIQKLAEGFANMSGRMMKERDKAIARVGSICVK
jgi:hypothetical protein